MRRIAQKGNGKYDLSQCDEQQTYRSMDDPLVLKEEH